MSKICSRCSATMGMGAPHSEEIKIQYECWCGNIETELYSAEELERNRRIEAENAEPFNNPYLLSGDELERAEQARKQGR